VEQASGLQGVEQASGLQGVEQAGSPLVAGGWYLV